MALNIGAVNFGIDANTDGLRRSIGLLTKFRQTINDVARTQSKTAGQTAAALSKQESAIKRNLQQFLNLRQAMQKAEFPAQKIQQLEQRFSRLTLELTSGKLSIVQYNRAMDAFKKSMGESSRALKEFTSVAGGKETGKLSVMLRNLESSAVLAIGPLSGVGARIRSLGAIAGRSGLALVGLFAGVTALAVGFAKLSSSALRAGRVFEASFARFKAASGDIAIANKQMGFVTQTALALGLRIDTSAKAFSRLSAAAAGTSLAGEGARKVFLAVSKAAAALRLEAGEVEGTFRAIEQMMSKGSVQAEELRGQLGERLPGAFRLAAEAMGVTTMKLGQMLKAGEVLAEDFLPKLAVALESAFGDAAADNINSFQGSMNNLSNQALLFGNEFNRVAGVTDLVVKALHSAANAVEFLRRNLVNLISAVGAIGVGLAFMARAAIAKGIMAIALAIRSAAIATFFWNAAILANPLGKLVAVVTKFGVAIAVSVAAFFGFKAILDDSNAALDDMETMLDALEGKGINAAKALGGQFAQLTTSLDKAAAETHVLQEVLSFMGRFGVKDIERLTLRFQTLGVVKGLAKDQLTGLLVKLREMGSGPIKNDVNSIADAFFAMMARALGAREELEKYKSAQAALQGAADTVVMLDKRFEAMQQGLDQVKFFDEITSAGIALRKTFEDQNIAIEEQERRVMILVAALIRNRDAMEALTEAEKTNTQAKRDAEAAQKKMNTGIVAAVNKIGILRARLKALSEGPESFEVFQKVTIHVMKFRNTLLKAGVAMEVVVALTKEYRRLLEELHKETDKYARAADQMAAAITNSLENILVKGGSVKEMLHSLAQELLRVALRALFLDDLQASLSTFFKQGNFPSATVTTGGGGGTKLAGASRGLNFRVPGSGGSDSVPIQFMAKPGEVVSVKRPDQITGGGGATVVINQNNTFERTIADSGILIPILEENNRKLLGEFLDGLDRGKYA